MNIYELPIVDMIYVDMQLLPWKITNHHNRLNLHRIEQYRKINMRSDAINNQKTAHTDHQSNS